MAIPIRQNGFTLIELLVVVGVIGILAMIASSNYGQAIERAEASACQQNLRTVFTALQSYRLDYNHFPPADGLADVRPQPDRTAWGCGPAANGYWSGVSLLLTQLNYCPEDALYCPAFRRMYSAPIDAYTTCSETGLAGKQVPQWRFFRYAYNSAATDAGGYDGGEFNIDRDVGKDEWLVRCAHVDVAEFDKERGIRFPFRVGPDPDNPKQSWYGEFELTLHGTIQLRAVQLR